MFWVQGEYREDISDLDFRAALYWNGQNLCVHQLLRLYLRVREGGTVSRLYRHIRQAAIPARVVLGTAVFKSVPRLRIPVLCDAHARLFRVTSVFTK